MTVSPIISHWLSSQYGSESSTLEVAGCKYWLLFVVKARNDDGLVDDDDDDDDDEGMWL